MSKISECDWCEGPITLSKSGHGNYYTLSTPMVDSKPLCDKRVFYLCKSQCLKGFMAECFSIPKKDFEKTIVDQFLLFLAAQESMSDEFKKILHDNLWDLYES